MANGTIYTVKSGDTLWAIGQRHNIPWEKIWEAEENYELRKARGNPNILEIGDKVFVPDLDQRDESGGTEQKHTYRKPGKVRVRIAVLDLWHDPMPDTPYTYKVSGNTITEGHTDSEGIAELHLPDDARDVVLCLPWGDFPVELGVLDPAHTIRGIQQRLTNLGIPCGPIDGLIGKLTRAGITEFQRTEKINLTGEPDAETIRCLRDRHDGETLPDQEELEKSPPPPPPPEADEPPSASVGSPYDLYPDAEEFYGNNGLDPSRGDA